MNDLLRRQAATETTLSRFRDTEFSWKEGVTCVHLAHAHLRSMGHRPPSLPCIRSEFGARRALAKRGWTNVSDMLAGVLGESARIAPARMLLGDLAVLEGGEGIGSIMICAGPHKLLGWHEDAPALIVLDVELHELLGAWRV